MSRSSIQSHKNLEFERSPFDNNGEPFDENIPSQVDDIHSKTEDNMIQIFFVITMSNIWSLVLIILPVAVTLGNDNLYYKQK